MELNYFNIKKFQIVKEPPKLPQSDASTEKLANHLNFKQDLNDLSKKRKDFLFYFNLAIVIEKINNHSFD
jgi:hypothetical protein